MYGWQLDYTLYGIPAASVVLLRRQWLYSQGKDMINLSEIEEIDNGKL